MTRTSPYVEQIKEACRLTADAAGARQWEIAYQSRSGPPSQPWLEPDIRDALSRLAEQGALAVVISPIGFVSDHMEVIYDLDTDARRHAEHLGLRMERAETAGSHPLFVRMIRELIEQRIAGTAPHAIGDLPPAPDECAAECCAIPRRP